jgi:hypothetical protein
VADEGELKIPQRYYVAGDEVVLQIKLQHTRNIEEIRVAYGKDGGRDNTMTFIGEVDTTEVMGRLDVPGPVQGYVPHASPYTLKESTAVLRMLVDVDHAPGHYELIYLVCRTAEGRVISVRTDEPDVSIESDSFRVLPEQGALDPQGVRVKILDEDTLQED